MSKYLGEYVQTHAFTLGVLLLVSAGTAWCEPQFQPAKTLTPHLVEELTESEAKSAPVLHTPRPELQRLKLNPIYASPLPLGAVQSGVFQITSNYTFENTAQAIAPSTNTACPQGRAIVSGGSDNLGPWLRNLYDASGQLDTNAPTTRSTFPVTVEQEKGTDNLIVKSKDGSLIAIRMGTTWASVAREPNWWDHVSIQHHPKGARVGAFVWRSTDCGQTWTLLSVIDPIALNNGRHAVPRPGEDRCIEPTDLNLTRTLFDSRVTALTKSRRLEAINGFIASGDQSIRYNAVWRSFDDSNSDVPWVAGWARTDFDEKANELRANGYRLTELNAFVVPGVPNGERFNAIWEKSNADRQAVWGWARPDFERKNSEMHVQGYRLYKLSAFVLPGPSGGERFNAIWTKTSEDRPAVWGWARADFDKKYNEMYAQGYRPIQLNAFVLPGPQGGERFNAIWTRIAEDRPAVWGWALEHFDSKSREMQAAGYRLWETNTFVLPGTTGERFNGIWVRAKERYAGCFGGWDRIEAYVDPWNGKIYVSMNAAGGPIVDYNTWKQTASDDWTNYIVQSSDGGRTWQLIHTLSAWTPMVMTSTSNGRLFIYSVIGSQPTLFYSLLNSQPMKFSGPVNINYNVADGNSVVPLPASVDPMYSELVYKATNSISRISVNGASSKVRLSYQWLDKNSRTAVAVVRVEVPNDTTPPIVTPLSIFQAANTGNSILSTTFVDPDPAGATTAEANISLLYWVEGSTDSTREGIVRYSMFRGDSNGTAPQTLGGPYKPVWSVAHYLYGGSFLYPNGDLGYLAQWVQSDGIRANIITIPARAIR
jgi:hypothetical protein